MNDLQTKRFSDVYPVDPQLSERVYVAAELSPLELERRLEALGREPSAERALTLGGAALGAAGLLLGLGRSKKWLGLSGLGGLLMFLGRFPAGRPLHDALQRAGLRRQITIERERAALHTLVSTQTDPAPVGLATPPSNTQERLELALQAAGSRQMANLILDRQTPNEVATTGSIQFIGTATTLIRYGGFTILTDPNFIHAGEKIVMGHLLPIPRLTNPALEIEDLPPLDLCLLSHMHGDHFDQVAEERLPKSLPVLTTPDAARILRSKGFGRALPLETWQSITLHKGDAWLRITAMPGRHGPKLIDPLLPGVMGSLLEWGQGEDDTPRFRMYITGDTLYSEDLAEIPRRFPNLDLAVLHLGGTRMLGLLLTMDAEQGVRALDLIRPKAAMPIHFNDYPIFRSSLAEFIGAVERARLPVQMHYLLPGETLALGK